MNKSTAPVEQADVERLIGDIWMPPKIETADLSETRLAVMSVVNSLIDEWLDEHPDSTQKKLAQLIKLGDSSTLSTLKTQGCESKTRSLRKFCTYFSIDATAALRGQRVPKIDKEPDSKLKPGKASK